MTLEEKISLLIPTEKDFVDALQKEFLPLHLSKGHLLFQSGSIARHIYFIESGLARMYYFNDTGKDITYEFFLEENFVAPSESFLENLPSKYNIELLEDSHLRCISQDGLNRLLNQFPILEKFKSYILSHFLYQANRRIVALQFQNAQQRYEELEHTKPTILQRAPLGHIASYLGITQETLSRIRSKK